MTKETRKFLGLGALNSPRGAVGLGLPVLRALSDTTRCPESPGPEPPGGRLTYRPHRLHLKDLGIPTSGSSWHGHLRFQNSFPFMELSVKSEDGHRPILLSK